MASSSPSKQSTTGKPPNTPSGKGSPRKKGVKSPGEESDEYDSGVETPDDDYEGEDDDEGDEEEEEEDVGTSFLVNGEIADEEDPNDVSWAPKGQNAEDSSDENDGANPATKEVIAVEAAPSDQPALPKRSNPKRGREQVDEGISEGKAESEPKRLRQDGSDELPAADVPQA